MQILIRAPEELKERLKQAAEKMGMPVNSLLLQILWEWVKRENGKQE